MDESDSGAPSDLLENQYVLINELESNITHFSDDYVLGLEYKVSRHGCHLFRHFFSAL
jgi:hypothetical protein